MAEADVFEEELAALRRERAALRGWLQESDAHTYDVRVQAAVRRGLKTARPCARCPWAPRRGTRKEAKVAETGGVDETTRQELPWQLRPRWNAARIVAAIQAYHAATGLWPLQVDFCSANGLPAANTVDYHMGSLAEARRQAGMPGGGCEHRGPWEPAR